MATPNFELIKDAYQILGGIPARQFNLLTLIEKRTGKRECGTIACGMGWLSIHPRFKKLLGAEIKQDSYDLQYTDICYEGIYSNSYTDAAQKTFGITTTDVMNLFSPRGGSSYDSRGLLSTADDKTILLNRIISFLRSHGQLKEQLAEKSWKD